MWLYEREAETEITLSARNLAAYSPLMNPTMNYGDWNLAIDVDASGKFSLRVIIFSATQLIVYIV